MSKENFKNFAKEHPELADNVLKGKTTWQKLYELYDIYGEKSNIWGRFQSPHEELQLPLKDFFQTLKNLDMETVQKGVTNLQKTIGLIQDLGITQKQNTNYEPQPIYRRFED